jgi:hypothetical protein
MKLEDYKKKEPFCTPEGYFPDLNRRIAEATHKAPAKDSTGKRVRIGLIAKWTTVAAMFAIILTIAVNGFDTSGHSTANRTYPIAQYIFATNENDHEEYYGYEYYEGLIDNYEVNDYTFYCCLTEYEQ